MAATVGGLPRPGDRCRVVAWPRAVDGRKLHAGSAVLGPDGEVLAAARTLWITVARRAVSASTGSPTTPPSTGASSRPTWSATATSA
jgi:acyl-CoA thioesterase FadM